MVDPLLFFVFLEVQGSSSQDHQTMAVGNCRVKKCGAQIRECQIRFAEEK